MTVRDQVMAAGRYLLDRGYKPGEHGVENMYAAILAGQAHLIHCGDLHAGGVAPSAAVAAREMMDDEWATTRRLMFDFGRPTDPNTPDPANDFNAQELDAIAPPLPAMPEEMRRARLPPNPVPRPSDLPSIRPRGQSRDPKDQSRVPLEDRALARSAHRPSSRAAITEQHRLRALETVTRRVRPTTHNPMRRSSPQRRLRPST